MAEFGVGNKSREASAVESARRRRHKILVRQANGFEFGQFGQDQKIGARH
jgi:hypothetical protein